MRNKTFPFYKHANGNNIKHFEIGVDHIIISKNDPTFYKCAKYKFYWITLLKCCKQ